MFLDKYTPANHDLYNYEFNTNDASIWNQFLPNEEDPEDTRVSINPVTSSNTNCILPIGGDNSPPWHIISSTDRRLNFLATDYILEDSVKDRYIKNSFSDWRTATNSTELHLSNLWNTGSVHFIAITDSIYLCSRTAFDESLTRHDISMKRFTDGRPSYPTDAPVGPQYFHEGGSKRVNVFMKANGGGESQSVSNILSFPSVDGTVLNNFSVPLYDFPLEFMMEGGNSPMIKDPLISNGPMSKFGSEKQEASPRTYCRSSQEDSNKWSKDFWVIEKNPSAGAPPPEYKLKWCTTEEQLLDNSYYDGTHFYSPVLYGIDDNGRVFKVRRRYWAQSANHKPTPTDVINSPAEYVSVDGVFGKPIAMWRGSASSPMFVKTIIDGNTEWALYGMSSIGASFTDPILREIKRLSDAGDSQFAGALIQKVPNGSFQNVRDILSSDSTLSYTSSSATVTKGIAHKMGVEYSATDDATSLPINVNIETEQLVKDPAETINTHLQVPPTLKDESLSIDFVYDVVKSGYMANIVVQQPPYSLREFGATDTDETTLQGDILPLTPHMIKLNVDQSTSNINNPSGAPYTAEIEWYRVEDGNLVSIDKDIEVASRRHAVGRAQIRQNDYLKPTEPQTSTTALTPCLGYLQSDLDRMYVYIPKSRFNLNYRSKNFNEEDTIYSTPNHTIVDDGEIVTAFPDGPNHRFTSSNNYIQPTGDVPVPMELITSYEPYYREHKIVDSFFLDEFSNVRDTNESSTWRINSPGTKLKCVFNLINEFGRSSYEVIDERFYTDIHNQDVRDEFAQSGEARDGSGNPLLMVYINGPQMGEDSCNVYLATPGDFEFKIEARGTSWSGFPRKYLKQTFVFSDGTEVESPWQNEHEPLGSDSDYDVVSKISLPLINGGINTQLEYIRIIVDEVPGDIGSSKRITFDTVPVCNPSEAQPESCEGFNKKVWVSKASETEG